MQSRWRSPLFLALLLLSVMASSEIAFGSCIQYPRDSEDPIVEVCEHSDSYIFRLGDMSRAFSKEEFRLSIQRAAFNWLSEHDQAAILPATSVAQIWMSIPMANPEAAQPRALILTSSGWVSFWFDLNKMDWEFADRESAIIGKESYPKSYGHRPGFIMVQSHSTASAESVEEALLNLGAITVVHRGQGVLEASCKIFDERELAERARSRSDMIKHAQVNAVMEWIADRQMAFSFNLQQGAD